MQMLTFIPSKTIRKYIQYKNIEFTDPEKATMIYNAGAMWPGQNNNIYDLDSKNTALKNLMEQTPDTTLRQQIAERLDEDKTIFQKFPTGSSDIFYEVQLYDECGDKSDHLFFSSFRNAADWAKKYIQIVPPDKISPTPFRPGDIVKNLNTGRYGVIAIGDEGRKNVEKAGSVSGYHALYLDETGHFHFCETGHLCVYYLYDHGMFDHEHPYPWELEYTHLLAHSDICSPNIIEAMLCSCRNLLMSGGGDPGFLQEYTLKMSMLSESELRSAIEEIEKRCYEFIHSDEFDTILAKYFERIEHDLKMIIYTIFIKSAVQAGG